MRVAIDAREMCGKPTGVGRYLRELLTEWDRSSEAARHEWSIYVPAHAELPGRFAGRLRVLPGQGGTAWEQWTLARAIATDRPDVLFAPAYSAPLTASCPIALAVHDVSYLAHPEWFAPREGLRRRLMTSWSVRRAAVILTISEFSKREIVARLGQPPDRVRVTYLGHRRPSQVPPSLAREPVILFVGTILPRRHVAELIEAFARAVAPRFGDARLEIVGEDRRPGQPPLERLLDGVAPDVRARVRLRSYVGETALQDLYSRAAVFAFLSDYEGFGLTPLEALSAGVAPVVLDTPVAREIYGDAARYVAPGSRMIEDLAEALTALVGDVAAREAILAHGPSVLSRYDWTRTAAATLTALEDAAGAR